MTPIAPSLDSRKNLTVRNLALRKSWKHPISKASKIASTMPSGWAPWLWRPGKWAAASPPPSRYAAAHLHPSAYCVFHITATSGSIIELYRQLLGELGTDTASFSKAVLLKRIRREIVEMVCGKKIHVVLVIDEASLLRMEVLAEIHTLRSVRTGFQTLAPPHHGRTGQSCR